MLKALSTGLAFVWLAAPTLAANPCPTNPAEASPEKGTTGYESPKSQPTERSSIVPPIGGDTPSAAPTVQSQGQIVPSETECPRFSTDPNTPEPKR